MAAMMKTPQRELVAKPGRGNKNWRIDIVPTITSESEVKDDLKSLPMPELQAKLGSSPDGLSQAEAQKRLTQYGPNEIA
jgi:hypothetical protein